MWIILVISFSREGEGIRLYLSWFQKEYKHNISIMA